MKDRFEKGYSLENGFEKCFPQEHRFEKCFSMKDGFEKDYSLEHRFEKCFYMKDRFEKGYFLKIVNSIYTKYLVILSKWVCEMTKGYENNQVAN